MHPDWKTAHATESWTRLRLSPDELRRRSSADELDAASTAEIEPIQGVVGQEDAVEALRYGLEVDAPGQNVYVRGLTGTGRSTLVGDLLTGVQPACPPAPDRCYVYDFDNPQSPALVTLPRGEGRRFKERIDELIAYIVHELLPALNSEEMQAERSKLEREAQERMSALGAPFEEELARNDLAMVMLQTPQGLQPAIAPVFDGKPALPEELAARVQDGRLSQEDLARLQEKIAGFTERMAEVGATVRAAGEELRDEVRELLMEEARNLLSRSVHDIEGAFPGPAVQRFLTGVVNDVVQHQLHALEAGQDITRRYRVNAIHTSAADDPCPVRVESQPSLARLIGVTERELHPGGMVRTDHMMVHGGALLEADGGYLVLEAREVLTEPGAWQALVRTLRTGKLEIRTPDSPLLVSNTVLTPEPIPIKVKVVLIGDPGIYALLDSLDPDFPHLFKVLADFDDSLPRDIEGLRYYGGVLSRLARQEGLPHFDADAVAALSEHGARIAGRQDRLTTRFGRLCDLAREAAFLVRKAGGERVSRAEVREAIRRSRHRGDLPARRFRRAIAEGTIRIQTSGEAVGQVNGLAVTQAGPLTYGFPARITATIGAGHAGAINIEREAQLSGAIHTKGFYILGGLLRHLLRCVEHPLAFSASIAFEQSYGGIDGDSASGAEMCCLLSTLTGAALRQGIAMTGAIDQLGNIQPIGAATEKIEGFFAACVDAGLTGDQGVIIPRANMRDLMLSEEVVEACAAGRFHVWAVSTIDEALEIFTGIDAGEPDPQGIYPEGTLLEHAVARAGEFYWMVRHGPQFEEVPEAEEAGEPSPEELTPQPPRGEAT